MAAIWPRANIKLISFSIERTQIYDFDVYFRVFRHGRHSSVAKKHPGHCSVGQIQDGRHFLTELKQIHYFGIYLKVFRFARHSGKTRMHPRNCIVGQI